MNSADRARWLEERKAALLPVGYFHLVFTLPRELNLLALSNKKVGCDILFKAALRPFDLFQRAFTKDQLQYVRRCAPLAEPKGFHEFSRSLAVQEVGWLC